MKTLFANGLLIDGGLEHERDSHGLTAIRTIQALQRTLWAGVTTVRNELTGHTDLAGERALLAEPLVVPPR